MTEAYPLHWPPGRPRARRRERSRFSMPPGQARDNLLNQLRMMGARHVVLSSDVALRQDGLPYAGRTPPDDPGVAVYFEWKKRQMCFACDRWDRVHDNTHAVGKTIEALRGLDRWGTGDMVEAAFTGFEALPAPETEMPWWEVLGLDHRPPNLITAEGQYRAVSKTAHPDNGGSHERVSKLNHAIEQARGDYA